MKKKPNTPRSKARSALRRLWMYSREHQAALKLAGRKCATCGIKASVAKGKEVKVHVHHVNGINWDGVIDIIFERILVDPKYLIVLCEKCHKELHDAEKK